MTYLAAFLDNRMLVRAIERYLPDGLEVEFVTGAGRTQALMTLKVSDVHPVADNELLAVRRVEPRNCST